MTTLRRYVVPVAVLLLAAGAVIALGLLVARTPWADTLRASAGRGLGHVDGGLADAHAGAGLGGGAGLGQGLGHGAGAGLGERAWWLELGWLVLRMAGGAALGAAAAQLLRRLPKRSRRRRAAA